MIAKNLDELLVYQKALTGSKAISALLNRPGLCKDFKLRHQLSDASDSTCSNISEGFGQQSDRKFAQYLYIARGSANEVRTRLGIARERGYITSEHFAETTAVFEAVGRMSTRLIQYLRRSDRRRRG
jgi:four helix bundle protein